MAALELRDVKLLIKDQVFVVNRDILCQHSDYFSAMFSGNFSELNKQEVTIEVSMLNSCLYLISYHVLYFLIFYIVKR